MTDFDPAPTEQPDVDIVIVGAGFSGIGAAIKLKQAGLSDFVILEQADDIGGTWRDNTYPGVAVDIPSQSYQFSFELNPDWSRLFAAGAEVKAYADHCVDKYGLRPHLRLNTTVTEASFDEEQHLWRALVNGEWLTARWVLTAVGGLVNPKLPDIPGLDEFQGTIMHTARWDHDHDFRGERVAVIGTGPSGVQVAPELAPVVDRLYMYQRSPVWMLPKPDVTVPAALRTLYRRLPLSQQAVRLGTSAAFEAILVAGVMYNRQLPLAVKGVETACKAYLRTQVPDPALRKKFVPAYGFGCKRPTFSNTYLRMFKRDNATLVTDPIQQFTATGIRTRDGVEREIDTVVLATGFLTTEAGSTPPIPVVGRNGVELGEYWQANRFKAFHGATVPGFPNMFAIFGPNATTGSSWMFMVETQTKHALRIITEAKRRGATLAEIRDDATDDYFDDMRRRFGNSVFLNSDCSAVNTSVYLTDDGDPVFVRPSTAVEAWWSAGHFPLDLYRYEQTRHRVKPAAKQAQEAAS